MKVFRPFWSYDVKKTEKWLTSMAETGLFLVKLNRWTRCFFFRQDEPKFIIYRIGFDNMQSESLSKTIIDEGWIKVSGSGKWFILANERPLEQIKISPVREGIIRHNRIIKYIFTGILLYLSFTVFINLSIMALVFFSSETVEVVDSPMWIVTYASYGIAIAVYAFCVYSIIKINKNNKHLDYEKLDKIPSSHIIEERLSREKEKQLKSAGQMIVQRKFGWMYAPDKLEKWLEAREELGLNLYRVGKSGTIFYFIKGNSRKVSYCADYQNVSNDSYFNFLCETGWKSVYSTNAPLQKWTIWSREYSEGEARPEIYSEKSHQLKHARRAAIAYTIMFIPMVLMYTLNISLFFEPNYPMKFSFMYMILFVFGFFMFGSFIVRIWLYYIRLRNRVVIR